MISTLHNPNLESLVIRTATTDDEPSLEVLAELDSAVRPNGPLLIAEVGAEPVAALSLADGDTIANPFRPTADVVALLRLRADQLRFLSLPGSARGLFRRAPASGQSVRHARDRLHRLLKSSDVSIQHLHGNEEPVQHLG